MPFKMHLWALVVMFLVVGTGIYLFSGADVFGGWHPTITLENNKNLDNGTAGGLVAHYTFDGKDMINNIADSSGNGKNGTLSLGTTGTTTAPGKIGQALSFDGLNVSASLSAVTTAVQSVAFWMKAATSTASSSIIALNGSASVRVLSGVVTATGFGGTTVIYVDKVATATTLNDTNWHHVVVTTTSAITPSAATVAKLGGLISYGGLIDDLRLYNRVLSQSEVTRLYNLGSADPLNSTLKVNKNLDSASAEVGHWTFDGKDMTSNVADVSGNGVNGTLTVGASGTTTIIGKIGQALNFDGINTTISLSAVASNVNAVAFWVQEATSTASSSIVALNGSASVRILSGVVTATGFTTPTIYVDNVVTTTLNDTRWHFVVVTSGTAITPSAATVAKLGGLISFGGNLDDLRFYGRALTQSDVTRLYQLGAGHAVNRTLINNPNLDSIAGGLAGHWTFDGKDMTSNVADVSGNGNNGRLVNFSTTTAPGAIGQALFFTPIGPTVPYIQVNNAASLQITGDITIAAWIKEATTSDFMFPILGRMNEGFGIDDYTFKYCGAGAGYNHCAGGNTDNQLEFEWTEPNSFQNVIDSPSGGSGPASIFAGNTNWHHVAVTRAGAAITFYVDGTAFAGNSSSSPFQNHAGDNVYIGTDNYTYAPDQPSGSLDDVRLYNRALSAAEIKRLYKLR